MKFTTLGHSGLKVSRICFGCMSIGGDNPLMSWTVDEDEGRRLVRLGLESGINFFDTANAYAAGGSETHLGRAIKDFARRDEVVIATKGFFGLGRGPNRNGLSRKALFQQFDDSLRRLGMDYVDLYQIHRFDEDTPIEETMQALHDLVKSGRVRYIGASSMSAWQFQKMQFVAEQNGWSKFISMQNQYSLLYREEEREMMPLCIDQNVGSIPWSPLARGVLTRDWGATSKRSEGDYYGAQIYSNLDERQREIVIEQDRRVVQAVADLAERRGVSRAQIGLAWHHHKPAVTAPIVGIAKESHLADAVASLDIELSEDEIAALEANYMTRPEAPSGAIRPRFDFTVTVRG
ncbi:MAG: aldo/keto reductase [Gammaproteobacteria bacterium AqS3]|nr:aldo/keto reductase [Gammaproteobacteria bacterium AqS3]